MKNIFLYPVEAIGLALFWIFARLLGLKASSAFFGFLFSCVGPLLPVHRVAQKNIKCALPEQDHQKILQKMWWHLGRVVGEYPHLWKLKQQVDTGVFEIEGKKHLQAIQKRKGPVFFMSAHFGNWEIPNQIAMHMGYDFVAVYRRPNSVVAEWFLSRFRPLKSEYFLQKGPKGARKMLSYIKKGYHVGFMMDQKMNDGMAVPFFGRDAMTAPAMAQLALKYKMPIYTIHVVRVKGTHFKIIIEPPLAYKKTADKNQTVYNILVAVNQTIERWIRKTPEQWLWVHRRWPNTD